MKKAGVVVQGFFRHLHHFIILEFIAAKQEKLAGALCHWINPGYFQQAAIRTYRFLCYAFRTSHFKGMLNVALIDALTASTLDIIIDGTALFHR
ncbi:hypothetical protein D3C80_1548370 [compost metagenome]